MYDIPDEALQALAEGREYVQWWEDEKQFLPSKCGECGVPWHLATIVHGVRVRNGEVFLVERAYGFDGTIDYDEEHAWDDYMSLKASLHHEIQQGWYSYALYVARTGDDLLCRYGNVVTSDEQCWQVMMIPVADGHRLVARRGGRGGYRRIEDVPPAVQAHFDGVDPRTVGRWSKHDTTFVWVRVRRSQDRIIRDTKAAAKAELEAK